MRLDHDKVEVLRAGLDSGVLGALGALDAGNVDWSVARSIVYNPSPPVEPAVGDMWCDTSVGVAGTWKVWHGGVWVRAAWET